MEYYLAYDLTLRRFKIKASEVSDKTGIGESVISRFRNDKQDLGPKHLKKLVDALPHTAREYFWLLSNCKDEEMRHLKISA